MITTIDDIKELIASDESRTLELKKTTGELKDGMHSACAFLNTEGGWLFFGVTPKSLKIIGQEVTDKTQQEIAQALAGLEPAVDVKVEYVDVPEYPGNKIIAMHFDGWVWGERPHTYHGCPYYKVESTTKVMPQDMYDERIRAHQPQIYSWEGQTANSITLADLNEKHIRGCIRLGVEGGRIPASAISAPIEDTLAKWKLLKNGVPTNGAAMLFSDNIDDFPQFRLRMARFLGTDKNEFIDNQRVEGGFFELLDAGMAFFFKHLNLGGKITNHSLQREEHLEVPYKALREALINSLCHRQWEKYNLTNSIAIYDDRIEIANPGIFPPQITPESIKKPHESYPYNLKIAEALYKSTYLESWGSGAKRIMDACREQGVEEPVWRWDGGFVIVTFKRPTYRLVTHEQEAAKEDIGGDVTISTPQAPLKYPSSTPQVELLIQKMSDSYMTLKEIAELCGIRDLKYFRESYIAPALEIGVIERLYPNQPKHPKQQYRLTGITNKQ
ncbi:ATP-binding protein [Parabacteroides sp. ZJ-118]|uniref:ATP-binding protein n=1 Tax=Parabacteroides sp. ZJ-118 TaxID=2709398 RepID=UPI0013EBC7AC|nr:ATP-binding protein [Parabacteroides sp. ZJ-118]